jgi:predicted nucleotide-binding protein
MKRPSPLEPWTRKIPYTDRLQRSVIQQLESLLRSTCARAKRYQWPSPLASKIETIRANIMIPDLRPQPGASEFPGRLKIVAAHSPGGKFTFQRREFQLRFAPGEGIAGNAYLRGRPFAEYGRYGISEEKLAQITAYLVAVFGFPLRMPKTEQPFGVLCVDFLSTDPSSPSESMPSLRGICEQLEGQLSDELASVGEILNDAKVPCMELHYSARDTFPRTVFLTHGHDHALRDEVQQFLRRLKIDVTVLENEPGQGETIIEKFERLSQADFAIILLTPDDVGFPSQSPLKINYRPRQNVIMELGFFAGVFGRKRVCYIEKGKIEKPSNIGGIEMINVEKKDWQKKLASVLRDAGFELRGHNS